MITSESSNNEFHRFFDEHREELSKRLLGLLLNRHRRTILSLLKRGAEIPPIWGMLKLPEATLYMLPIGIKPAKVNFQVTSLSCFMVMKDLREQTPVFITDSKPHVIMYSAHAVRRYNINPRVFGDMSKIYGTNINRRELSIISTNGAYMGFADGKTEVFHAETFLSAGELRKDQLFLDASKSEDLKLWKTVREAFVKGEITSEELQSQLVCYPPDIAVSEGKIIKLSPEEAKLRDEENRKAISNPEYIEKAMVENSQRYNRKLLRKGYK